MAEPSGFLKKKAKERREVIDSKYGPSAYGGSKASDVVSSANTPLGGGEDGEPVTRASNFLRKKAAERRTFMDEKYGDDAYGGNGRYDDPQSVSGLNTLLRDVEAFSEQISSERTSRQGEYQSADDFEKYRRDSNVNIGVLQNKADIYRNFYTDNANLYESDSVKSILKALDDYDNYLSLAKGDLKSESEYWNQFEDEQAYGQNQKYLRWRNIPNADDYEDKSGYASTYTPGSEKFSPFSGTYINTGFGDVYYDYINGDAKAREYVDLNDLKAGGGDSVYATTHEGWKDLPQDVVKTFNYIYATEGSDAAYEYINSAAGKSYTGIEALALGALNGTGLASVSSAVGGGIAKITGNDQMAQRNKEQYERLLASASAASEEHPYTYGAGAVAGNLALAYGAGSLFGRGAAALRGGVTIGGTTIALKAAPVVTKMAVNALTFASMDSVKNIGAASAGLISGKDYAKAVLAGGAGGMAGGIAEGLVSTGISSFLQRAGMMTAFGEFIRAASSSTASAWANIGTSYVLSENKPDKKEIAVQLATAFALSLIQSVSSTYKTTQDNKAKMESSMEILQQQYSNMSQNWRGMTPEERAEAAGSISAYTQKVRESLNKYYMAGQQDAVNSMNDALNMIDAAMKQYADGFAAWDAGAAFPGNLIGDMGSAANGSETAANADIEQTIGRAFEQGITVAQGQPDGAFPSTSADVTSGVLPAAGAKGITGITPIDDAVMVSEAEQGVPAVKQTEQTPKAEDILVQMANQEAQAPIEDNSLVTNEVSQETPVTEPLRADITKNNEAVANYPAAPENAPQAVQTNVEAVRDFASTLDKSGRMIFEAMYNDGQAPDGYIREMMKEYNAGKNGDTFTGESPYSVINPAQAEAAYDAGAEDARSAETVVKTEGSGYTESESGGIAASELTSALTKNTRVDSGGLRYTITRTAAGYRGNIESAKNADSMISNARSTQYHTKPYDTYEEAVRDLVQTAQANGFVRRETTNVIKDTAADINPHYKAEREGGVIEDIDLGKHKKSIADAKSKLNLSDDESYALELWGAGSAYELTDLQRNQPISEWSEYDTYLIELITKGLLKHPKYFGITYRNLLFGRAGQDPSAYSDFLNKHSLGATVSLKAFTASSKDPNGYIVSGEQIIHMVIDGQTGYDISETYSTPEQKEVIYLPGTLLSITSIGTANDGHPIIYAKEILKSENVDDRNDGKGKTAATEGSKTAAKTVDGREPGFYQFRGEQGIEVQSSHDADGIRASDREEDQITAGVHDVITKGQADIVNEKGNHAAAVGKSPVPGETGRGTLDKVAPEDVPGVGGSGDAVRDAGENRPVGIGSTDESDTQRDGRGRSLGDREGSDLPAAGEVTEETPQQQIADKVAKYVIAGKDFTAARLFEIADKAYGGTMAEGAYTVKDAYDGMELAVNQSLMNSDKVKNANGSVEKAVAMVKILENMLSHIPTQSKRTAEMESFQQFSTPPTIAYLAAWSAGIQPGDVALEPSAGIGGIALWPKAWGATVYGNELSERRLAFLNQLGLDGTFNLNAEQIDNMLPDSIKPTVVLMNPPFSATAGRTTTNKTSNAGRHIEQALSRLEEGGRLVAVLGRGMSDDASSFKKWWGKIKSQYNVRANIQIDGKNYHKYGTDFDIQLVVIDKNGPTKDTLTGSYKNLDEIPKLMEDIRNDRNYGANNKAATEQLSDGGMGTGLHSGEPAVSEQGSGHSVRSVGNNDGRGVGRGAVQGSEHGGRNGGLHTVKPAAEEVAVSGANNTIQRGNSEVGSRKPDGRSSVELQPDRNVKPVKSEVSLDNKKQTSVVESNSDSVYSTYIPKKARIKGAKKHPAKLVESAAMAAVDPPDVTYTPNLPSSLITSGALSDAQLENIIYAGQAHTQMLPDGKTRKGYFIGDGTGVGKGRQLSGILMDNFRSGRKKAVWISDKKELIGDAKRDWVDLGGNADDIKGLEKFKYGTDLPNEDGIMFLSYDTLKGSQAKGGTDTRIEQLKRWLGEDFDGVIAFDEAHNMGNAISMKGKRGKTRPAQKALAGITLQQTFPNARVVYASATGATDISNYSYLERLGLWGKGTAFNDVRDFIAKISDGGLAAMELVARDMKAMGVYMARSISYDDVKYDTLQHDLNPMQTEIYNTMSRAWQKVFQNIGEALKTTSADKNSLAKQAAIGQFYTAQQRFYNQVLTSMSVPTMVADMRKELDAGHSCVIQLTNTNEAAANRAIAKSENEGTDLDDLDMTPVECLINYLFNCFPVNAYEEYTDENGNLLSRPVLDSAGNPVQDKTAVRQRDALIAEVQQMKVPDGPLELLFDAFGTEEIAERTGRSRRVVQKQDKNGHMHRVVEKRGAASGLADTKMFQDGKKRILVFSEAGGTGASYHADLRAKNQQQRIHYLLQPGWNAAKAVQGFGRTHRSNEANAPIYKLVTTNIMGQKRFTSTIARRLDQLGALTKGQRQTGSGMFGEKDNLENPIAQDALEEYYKVVSVDVVKKLGLYEKLYDQFGMYKPNNDTSRDIGRFLNRILALEVTEQNEVFQGFFDTFDRMMDKAIADGSVDMGLENYKADKINVVDEKVIRTDPSGADTKYVQMTAYNKPSTLSYAEVVKRPGFQGFVSLANGGVRAVFPTAAKTNATTGEIEERYRLLSPDKEKQSTYLRATMEKEAVSISNEQWKEAWAEETKKLPQYNESTLHLLTGTLLPIWNRLPSSSTRVMRILTGDGKQYLGRFIRATDIDTVLRGLGTVRTKTVYSPQQIVAKVMNEGKTVVLQDNKIRFVRKRVSGENRIEIVGSNVWYLSKQYVGIITEKINYDSRYFIPTGERGQNIIAEITRVNPVVDIRDNIENLVERNQNVDTVAQEINSAKTSIKQIPALFKDSNVRFGKVNIDIGGGKFDLATKYLKSIGTLNLVFDPYNRTEAVNSDTLNYLRGGYKADTATCANVLNVIKETNARANVILEMAKAIKPDGKAYFMVYEGDGSGVGRETSAGWQNNRKTRDYMDEIRQYFRGVSRKGKLIIAEEPKSKLPKASWEVSPGKGILYSKDVTNDGVPHPERWTAARVGDKNKAPKPVSDIIARIRHDFDLNVTYGHVRGTGVRGQFSPRDKGIRSRIANDLPTISHELGHALDDRYSILDGGITKGLHAELEKALGDLSTGYKPEQYDSEGLAEFLRLFLQNRETAAIDYPEFTKHFLGKLSGKDLTLIEQLADDVNAYYSLDADTSESNIRLREERRPDLRTSGEKIRQMGDDFYQTWVDTNHGIKLFDEATGSSVYKLATNSAYSDAIAGRIITGSLTDANGQYVGPGLKAALNGINTRNTKEYRAFGEYLAVRHGPEYLAEGKRVYADDRKNSTAFMQRRQMELEQQYPQFEAAAKRIYQFLADLNKTWGVDTNVIGSAQLTEWQERWPNYVPFYRAIDKTSRPGASRGYANQTNPHKRAKGSGLDIIQPVDNIIDQIVLLVNVGVRNNVMYTLRNAALNLEADAAFMEKIPTPMVPRSFDMTGVKGQLSEAIKESNMNVDDQIMADKIIADLSNVMLQFGRGKAHGNVVTVMVDGKPEFWKINDKLLLESVTSLSPAKLNGILEAYAKTTRFMTANITGNNPVWSIFSNAPRDLMTFAMYSKDKRPFKAMAAIGSAYINKIKGDHSTDPLYAEYLAMGGGQTSVYSADADLARKARKKLTSTTAQKVLSFANPINWVSLISDTIEQGPRFATYKLMRQAGLSEQEAFYEAMDVTVNFRRGGLKAREVNKIAPFFNAGVQGVDKFVRNYSGDDAPKSDRAKTVKSRWITYFAASAILGALMYALNSHDDESEKDYQQLSNYTKNSYWCIPRGDGMYFTIPKPRELAVLTSFFEACMEQFIGGNEHAFDEFYDYATNNFLPNVVSDVAQLPSNIANEGLHQGLIDTAAGVIGSAGMLGVGAYVVANRDFLGKPIESATMQYLEPKDRFNNATSVMAHWLGQAFNLSPVMTDYVGNQVLGYLWKFPKALFPIGQDPDYSLGVKSSYVKDNLYSQDLVNWLYDQASRSAMAKKSNQENMDKAITAKCDSSMTDFYSNFNALNKNKPDTEARRHTRQVVLDMISEYREASDKGTTTRAQDAVYAVIKAIGETSYMPSVMNPYVNDGNSARHTLTDEQYVTYQTKYLALYWDYAEQNLATGMSAKEKAAVLKAAKEAAKEEATNHVLARIGAPKTKYAEKYAGISTDDVIEYQAKIETNTDGSPKQEEVISIIEEMLNNGLDYEEAYLLFHTKYDNDKKNPWKKYAP
ncbi:MAG: strawberry notch family protein [Clostridiaceae bacterium]|nr:strawberry notch family protein [Clostridiaceae bacterium]